MIVFVLLVDPWSVDQSKRGTKLLASQCSQEKMATHPGKTPMESQVWRAHSRNRLAMCVCVCERECESVRVYLFIYILIIIISAFNNPFYAWIKVVMMNYITPSELKSSGTLDERVREQVGVLLIVLHAMLKTNHMIICLPLFKKTTCCSSRSFECLTLRPAPQQSSMQKCRASRLLCWI